MNKRFFPLAAVALLLSASSCSYDKTGTSFEVLNANEDENVNPAHIRGYGNREPGMGDPKGPKPSQYYAFSTQNLPAATRQQVEGSSLATQMVQVYYSPDRQLSDLAEQYGAGEGSAPTPPAAPDTTVASAPKNGGDAASDSTKAAQ